MARVAKALNAYRERVTGTPMGPSPVSQVTRGRKPPRVPGVGPQVGGFNRGPVSIKPHASGSPFGGVVPGGVAGGASAAGGTNMPPDPLYEKQVGGLYDQEQGTLAGLANQRTAGLLDYGYTATYDPTSGYATGLTFDPSNPNSRAAQLKKRFQEAKAGTTTGYAARGQLYSGAIQNAQNANADNYQKADDATQKALYAFLNSTVDAGRQAGNDYETGVGDAQAGRLDRLPTNPLENPSTGRVAAALAASGSTLHGQGARVHAAAGAHETLPHPVGQKVPARPSHGGMKNVRNNGRVSAGVRTLREGKTSRKAKR